MITDQTGSMHWISPEVWLRTPYQGPETDVWALGVMAYTMCAGALPFSGKDSITVYKAVMGRQNLYFPRYFSFQLKDFVSRTFGLGEHRRATLDDLRHHPWITGVTLRKCQSTDATDLKCGSTGALQNFPKTKLIRRVKPESSEAKEEESAIISIKRKGKLPQRVARRGSMFPRPFAKAHSHASILER